MDSDKSIFQRQIQAIRRLEDALAKRHPMFKRRQPGDSVYDSWGLECGPGWIPLLVRIADKAVELNADVRVRQIKEKFHSLRFYCEVLPSDGTDDLLYELIGEIEAQSSKICEFCGEQEDGHLHDDGDFVAYCEAMIRRLEESFIGPEL